MDSFSNSAHPKLSTRKNLMRIVNSRIIFGRHKCDNAASGIFQPPCSAGQPPLLFSMGGHFAGREEAKKHRLF